MSTILSSARAADYDYTSTRDLCIIYAPFAFAWCLAAVTGFCMVIRQERRARELKAALRSNRFYPVSKHQEG